MAAIARILSSAVRVFSDSAERYGRYCNTAVIVAAGNGTRAGGDVAKQLVNVGGMPVVARTVAQFEACAGVKHIVLVGREDELTIYRAFAAEYGFKKLHAVVQGGETRMESAFNGFCAIPDESDYVLIHDGARCLVTPDMITRVLAAAHRYGASCAACRAKDTPKIADSGLNVANTPERASVWLAQTPQAFKADLYRACAYKAREDGCEATDDCMLAERLGFRVRLVDCGYQNMKITTAEDFGIAEAILTFRQREAEKCRTSE